MNEAWVSSIDWPCSFLTVPNFRSASLSLRNTWPAVWAISVCMASRRSSFFESVCGLYRTSLSSQRRNGAKRLSPASSLSLRGADGEDFGPDVARRLGRPAGGVEVASIHPLVFVAGRIFRGLEEGVRTEPFPQAVEIAVELQAGGQGLRAGGEAALKPGIAGDPLLPAVEIPLPGVVAGVEPGEVPRVGHADRTAGRKLANVAHGYHWIRIVPQTRPAPKPLTRIRSPRWTRPARQASSSAMGMLPADVLP